MQKKPISMDEVMSYRNQSVILCYMRKHDVSIEVAKMHFRSMLIFLYFCGTSDNTLTPSEVIDEMWHTFILSTKDYDKFCQDYFGKKIHHSPDAVISKASKEKNQQQYADFYIKAEEVFRELDPTAFPKPILLVMDCSGGGDCSGDSGTAGDCGSGGSCGGSTNCSNDD